MLKITIECDRPAGQAIGIKEAVAQDLEKYGDIRVTEVREILPEQLEIYGLVRDDIRDKFNHLLADMKICSFGGGCAVCANNTGDTEQFECRYGTICTEDNSYFKWRGMVINE